VVALTLLSNRPTEETRRRLLTGYGIVFGAGAALVLATAAGGLAAAVHTPAFWLMSGLALLSGALAFVTTDVRGASVVLCPGLCFSFAILLCWGLAPAIVVHTASVVLVGLRLRYSPLRMLFSASQHALAFGAANGILLLGDPDPFAVLTVAEMMSDAATIVAAALVWLVVYFLQVFMTAQLRWPGFSWRQGAESLSHQALFKAALLLLSPVLAVATHVNPAFVLLIILPLYAVQRMARLSAERDRAAWVDPLTGLANRRGLQARFTGLMSARSREEEQSTHMALLMLDLDRFKHVNDALGHEMGDRLLIAIGERLMRTCPRGGVVGRLGGDEFAILAPNLHDLDDAERIAARVLADLSQPVWLDEINVDVTASVGIAVSPQHGDDFPTLMRHADVALYVAKKRGDSAASYDPGVDSNSPEKLGLLTDFRLALENPDRNEIELHYQPQVSLASGELVGVEALLRWTHPTRGMISTPDLLQVAEHTSVMHMLTLWVIDEVVAQLGSWQREGLTLRASLNISARDLYSGDIVNHLASRLIEHDVKPGQLQVEITESALMADPVRGYNTIMRISGLGIGVSLDDFGTGYSSLQHLRKLPLSEIKIDRGFVLGMPDNADDAAIVRSTVELARALGLRSVAEGVETEYAWQMLRLAGCGLAQGWFIARPMPGPEIARWHAGRRTVTELVPVNGRQGVS
jgi:diguanylate cyclase (GGDEF)-like protein